MEKNPLVSVPVITYNSSKTILETLESIKAQTYQNIELIISDDCSTDNTVEICKKWVSENEHRFVRTVVLESPVNTGISANGNRAEDVCQGEWVKGIAGDDVLLPKCIEEFLKFVRINTDAIYVFCKINVFGADPTICKQREEMAIDFCDLILKLNSEDQLNYILLGMCPPAPGCFYNRLKAQKLGIVNDERIKFIEDWPKWIKFLETGNRLYVIDKCLVNYRLGGISSSERWESLDLFMSKRQVFFYYVLKHELKRGKDNVISSIIDFECDLYSRYLTEHAFAEKIRHNKYFKFIYDIRTYFINAIMRIESFCKFKANRFDN